MRITGQANVFSKYLPTEWRNVSNYVRVPILAMQILKWISCRNNKTFRVKEPNGVDLSEIIVNKYKRKKNKNTDDINVHEFWSITINILLHTRWKSMWRSTVQNLRPTNKCFETYPKPLKHHVYVCIPVNTGCNASFEVL